MTKRKLIEMFIDRAIHGFIDHGWNIKHLDPVVMQFNDGVCFGIAAMHAHGWPVHSYIGVTDNTAKSLPAHVLLANIKWLNRLDKFQRFGDKKYLVIDVNASPEDLIDEFYNSIANAVDKIGVSIVTACHPSGIEVFGADETFESLSIEADLDI